MNSKRLYTLFSKKGAEKGSNLLPEKKTAFSEYFLVAKQCNSVIILKISFQITNKGLRRKNV